MLPLFLPALQQLITPFSSWKVTWLFSGQRDLKLNLLSLTLDNLLARRRKLQLAEALTNVHIDGMDDYSLDALLEIRKCWKCCKRIVEFIKVRKRNNVFVWLTGMHNVCRQQVCVHQPTVFIEGNLGFIVCLFTKIHHVYFGICLPLICISSLHHTQLLCLFLLSLIVKSWNFLFPPQSQWTGFAFRRPKQPGGRHGGRAAGHESVAQRRRQQKKQCTASIIIYLHVI